MALLVGLSKRGDTYYSKYKQRGKWVRTAVGKDLDAALEAHARLRGPVKAPRTAAIRFEELANRWLESQQRRNKATSVRTAGVHLRSLLSHFRGKAAPSIATGDVDAFIDARRDDGVSDLSVNNALRILKAILRFGVAEGMLDTLPGV